MTILEEHRADMSATIEVRWEGEGAVVVSQWFYESGDTVAAGDLVCELMQEKAVIEVHAPASGMLHIAATPDTEVPAGALLGSIGPGQP
jgi:pyruvate/2-oxoglutarate dehydrogenase complex dihydrolipoamide acyltransferase (E2) component